MRPGTGGEDPAVSGKRAGFAGLVVAAVAVWGAGGCMLIPKLGTDPQGRDRGQTYYVGGAGALGNIGTIDVPRGLRRTGYRGGIEVFGWQSILGGTIRDQVDRARNEEQARRLAERIQEYLDQYPGRQVSIIALSAGTGIVTWALEMLPDGYNVGNVAFLGSSLSRTYDLSAALRHVGGRLYVFHSTHDAVLRYGTFVAGSVDRELFAPSAAGLHGFSLPPDAPQETRELYKQHLRNRPYQSTWARFGYRGGHMDCTSQDFVRRVVAPLVIERVAPLAAARPAEPARAGRAPAGATTRRAPASERPPQ